MQYFFRWIDSYTDWIASFVRAQHVLAPLLLILIEELGIPIFLPGDAILAYTGYRASRSHGTNLVLAFIAGMIAIIIGSSILFLLARRWGKAVVIKLGKYLFLSESHIERAEKLFARYGIWTIIIGRHIPGMRVPITLFAAISGIRYRTFILSTIFSAIFWVLFYLYVGMRYGEGIRKTMEHYVGLSIGIIVAIIVIIIGLHVWGAYRERKRTPKS